MERKHTNKELLGKGVKFLAGAVVLSFLGPSIIYSSLKNQEHPLFIPVLILGSVVFLAAIYCIFKGILTIVKAVFD